MSTGHVSDIAALFDRNAARYDIVNTVISFGRDAAWRRATAAAAVAAAVTAEGTQAPRILDACGGTGGLAIELARRGVDVTIADASQGMLAVAAERAYRCGVAVRLVQTDLVAESAAQLAGAPFSGVTLAYGLRYMEQPAAFLHSLGDALIPEGVVVVLEFVVPPKSVLSNIAAAYFFRVLPRVAALLAGRGELYRELTATTRSLGTMADLLRIVSDSGLRPVRTRTFAGGLVAVVIAARPSGSLTVPDD